jgi:hypothetical protein
MKVDALLRRKGNAVVTIRPDQLVWEAVGELTARCAQGRRRRRGEDDEQPPSINVHGDAPADLNQELPLAQSRPVP